MRAAIDWFRANGYAPKKAPQRRSRHDPHRHHRRHARRAQAARPRLAAQHPQRHPLLGAAQRRRRVDAACAGAGQSAATRAFAAIEDGGPIDLVFSIGWAGALTPDARHRHAHNVAGVIDTRTGERFAATPARAISGSPPAPRVADPAEKRRLASTYNAALVDMEAAAIARLAAMRGIPFYAIKGVSDGLNDRLPDFNRFLSPHGQFQLPFTLFALCAPMVLARTHPDGRK
jgi:nucleoside phosphorylase